MIPDVTEADQRLDSWKAIAGYLGRDVSTVRRWERTLGLPVRRVPGTKGHSVFAFAAELDTWLKRTDSATVAADSPTASPQMSPAEPVVRDRTRVRRLWLPAVAMGLLLVAFVGWRGRVPVPPVQDLRLSVTSSGVTASTAAGSPLWRYDFSPGETTALPAVRERAIGVANPDTVLVATSYYIRLVDDFMRGGQLLSFSPDGKRGQTFSFEDRLSFPNTNFSPPWQITDYRVQPRGSTWQVAVAAHHSQWWPSLVTVLDSQWRRRGTFVHAGWIEMIQWLAPDRLLVGGFSNERDGGVAALLDAGALDGQAPVEPSGPYRCADCGRITPLRYVVFPRSEVNRVSGSEFNRARLQLSGDHITVRTLETPANDIVGPADVLYEFSPSLALISASYSDRYWELHQQLEAQGKLNHSRAMCPDRDGPRQIQIWEPAGGWQTVTIQRPASPQQQGPAGRP